MIVILNYRMNITKENEKALKEFFEKIGKEVNVDGNILYAIGDEETFYSDERAVEEIYLEKALNVAYDLKAVLHDNFVLEGTIDTSYAAGEYMDFQIDYKNGNFSAMYSDWYVIFAQDEYDNYKDFCESEGDLCSEEEFEALKDKEVYLVEGKDGNTLVESIPLIYTF